MNKPIVVTGGFGFIGSNMIAFLNKGGITPWVLEDFSGDLGEKWRNVVGLKYNLILDESNWPENPIIIHLGAISSTRVPMDRKLWETNFELTINLWKRASKLIYASSAATYGNEKSDFSERVDGLKPINPYGFSKWSVDNYFFGSPYTSPGVYGLRPFNVYGPREGHKGPVMASSIYNALTKQGAFYKEDREESVLMGNNTELSRNIRTTAYWHLMASGDPSIPNDQHLRDFIYVEDVCKIIWFFVENDPLSGLYNVGTGQPRSFTDVLKLADPTLPICYRPMPPEVHRGFQYYTCADLTKLRAAGYTDSFTTLEDGVQKTREWLASRQ